MRAAARPPRALRPALTLRPVAVLAVLALAAASAAIALLRADAAPTPVAGIVPLRVSSGDGIATGFAVAGGRVITVAHALHGPVTVGGRHALVVRVDRRSDLALLSAPWVGATAPDIASAANGEHLRVIRLRAGRPSSLSAQVRRAIVAHVRAPGSARARVRPALELAPRGGRIAPGDSGAVVLTDSGELAGIVFAVSRTRRDTAYAVDASQLRRLLR
jgi:hypothetical protein